MKKGSLNLSIQAIVILVMAMALLGIGLAFIRGIMDSGSDKFSEIIGQTELTNPPTASTPFVSDNTISVKSNSYSEFQAGVYNDGKFTNAVEIDIGGCTQSAETNLQVRSSSQSIGAGEYAGFKLVLIDDGTLSTGVYSCALEATDSSVTITRQVTVEINS